MAASNRSPRTPASGDEPANSGAGMAHLTVVPTNFDSDDERNE
ncbi:hypothetical protein SAMN05443661_11173 [Natronobacterium gregoryi]|uniref:Uncharacterized protein n=2 Tax=Natronobacterium gregoryi TaxID=44930 RepID=L0AIT0_NATGS|nr:hypothetical protein Natgr_2539 [Natronobacterium gregoryi SP2]SFJ01415.1 hypothetical protein SAMN05443661_11173 [Natronobacterium gregoryi]